ncbi:ABC transporter substrate-binding protein [Wenzhouxiangella sp. XN79A]|uniref:MlaC/ttg2D family ABC transporter substrate-binding protein n=1 Tax=Wenzhouxiangella sp. XN79A TaxID=2724193 RepID=UPI00144AA087|nr:ABC transporter substrate-binding protein [Wenzhouxiangella sp. XN79A]NKI35812.1 ABC transporter substrate-binding protein [Wenzhouxiangella sp. XN79A]
MNRILLAAFALLLASTPTRALDGPVEIVRETSNEIFGQIELSREHFEENPDALRNVVRELMLPRIDVVYSGRLVLGRAARGIERDKVIAFSDALSELLIERYATGLLEFRTRDQIEVLPLEGDNSERMTKVRTRVTLNNGKTAPVDYVFRNTDEGWKIFDVIVEGISYVATFRNQIGEQIRADGFDATLERLKAGRLDLEVEDV